MRVNEVLNWYQNYIFLPVTVNFPPILGNTKAIQFSWMSMYLDMKIYYMNWPAPKSIFNWVVFECGGMYDVFRFIGEPQIIVWARFEATHFDRHQYKKKRIRTNYFVLFSTFLWDKKKTIYYIKVDSVGGRNSKD